MRGERRRAEEGEAQQTGDGAAGALEPTAVRPADSREDGPGSGVCSPQADILPGILTPQRIVINRLHLKYAWRWRVKDEICLICQQEFNIACQSCSHPTRCVPCSGYCNHSFHYHCIKEWLENSKNCPLCRAKWVYRKIFKFDRPEAD